MATTNKNMIGTAKKIKMCGATISLGDWMEIEYRTGREMRGGRIEGEVVELWSPELSEGHLQARLSCGWCFHNSDKIINHKSATNPPNAPHEARLLREKEEAQRAEVERIEGEIKMLQDKLTTILGASTPNDPGEPSGVANPQPKI